MIKYMVFGTRFAEMTYCVGSNVVSQKYYDTDRLLFENILEEKGLAYVIKDYLRLKINEEQDAKIAAIFNESDNDDGLEFSAWLAEEIAYDEAYDRYLENQQALQVLTADGTEHDIPELSSVPSHTQDYGAFL